MSLEKVLIDENKVPGRAVAVRGEAITRAAKLAVMDLLFEVDDYVALGKNTQNEETTS